MPEKKDWDQTEVELTVTAKFRYKVDEENYGPAKTLEEAVAIDITNVHDDPIGMLMLEEQMEGSGIKWNVSWDLV